MMLETIFIKSKRIISLFLFTAVITTGCSADPENPPVNFKETRYMADEFYSHTVDMVSSENKLAYYAYEKDVLSPEFQKASTILINNDLKKMIEKSGRTIQKVNIYILSEDSEITPYFKGANIYATAAQIGTIEFQSALAGAAFEVKEPWVAYGIAAWVFENPVNEANLWNYYENTSSLDMLRLFGAHFNSTLYISKEIEIARDTAASLAKYIIEKFDWDLLLNGADRNAKQSWLYSLDVDKQYDSKLEGELQDFTFRSTAEYPLVVETDNSNYFIKKFEYFATYDQVENFIYLDRIGRECIFNYLSENLSENIDLINFDVNKHINYYSADDILDEFSSAAVNGSIYFNNSHQTHLNEVFNLAVNAEKYGEKLEWLVKALGNYILLQVENGYFKNTFDYIVTSTNLNGIYEDARNYYIKHTSGFKADSPVNAQLVVQAFVYLTYAKTGEDEFLDEISFAPDEELYINTPNELSEIRLISFISYLIDNYGFDKIMGLLKHDGDFTIVLGNDYNELKTEWLEAINE